MAKKKRSQAKSASVSTDLIDSFCAGAEKKFGPGATIAGSALVNRHVGVPLPALSLEYLFSNSTLCLGASYGIAGPPSSYKSSLALELGRLLASYNSINALSETEGGKIADQIIESIYGSLSNRLRMRLCHSVEDAQAYLTYSLNWLMTNYPDRDQLMGLVVDSLNGADSKETDEQMEKDGHAIRGFPVEALLWTRWFKKYASKLHGWPVVLIFVNHLKKNMDGQGYRHPGGDAQDFYATVYLHVNAVRNNQGQGKELTQLRMRVAKNSFGQKHREINTVFEVSPGVMRFDWEHSTADLLTLDKIRTRVKPVITVTSTSASLTAMTRTFSCKRLGLVGVSGSELGAAVHADQTLMSELREILGIRVNRVWDGLMPQEIVELAPEDAPPAIDEDAAELDGADYGDSLGE